MKRLITMVSVVMVLILGVSCISENRQDAQSVQNVDEELDQLKEELTTQYETTVNGLTEELDIMKERYERLLEETDEKIEEAMAANHQGKVETFESDGRQYLLYRRGADKLENGVIVVLESYDEEGDLNWMHTFNGIQVSELPIYSEIAVHEQKVYIRVDTTLYVFDILSGDETLIVSDVGQSDLQPLIDDDGTIYIMGQYSPYVTAIDSSGSLLWKLEDERYVYTNSIEIDGDGLKVIGDQWVEHVSKDGKITVEE